MTKPAGTVSLTPATFADLPGWASDDHLAAYRTFQRSCVRLIAAARTGNLAGKVATPLPLFAICQDALVKPLPKTRGAAREFFELSFAPHRVIHAGGQGLLTGYYEPLLEGSRKPTDRFTAPIYKRPADLINLVHEAERGGVGANFTHARKTLKGVVPFATRAEIEKGALKGLGLELLWLADPVDVFFLQIQGSGRIRLPDGSMVRVHYDGKNGHPYSSIGRYLIDRGILPADKLSMQALGRWLRSDPERAKPVMWHNASYVFFRELTGSEAESTLGVLEIPLTAGRSLAVDTSHHAIGSPVYVTSPTLTHARTPNGFHRLMIAQDVGSAIRGPERGDIFFGSGDRAGGIAGITKHPGNFYVLLPRPVPSATAPATPAPPVAKR
ncbi:MAG TPA: MltA domain-containing protein [Hyphomicrobiaceae bacterium]|nr:MltA domain-containing protein [Hyphomicrobiaceae bacterium]